MRTKKKSRGIKAGPYSGSKRAARRDAAHVRTVKRMLKIRDLAGTIRTADQFYDIVGTIPNLTMRRAVSQMILNFVPPQVKFEVESRRA